MILALKEIKSPGDLQRERVVMTVSEDGRIDDFVILRTRANTQMILGGKFDGYWLDNRQVSKGDRVVLYTKKGAVKEKIAEDGSKSHFIYWGSTEPLWSPGTGCVLTLASPRKAYRVGGFDHNEDVEPEDAQS